MRLALILIALIALVICEIVLPLLDLRLPAPNVFGVISEIRSLDIGSSRRSRILKDRGEMADWSSVTWMLCASGIYAGARKCGTQGPRYAGGSSSQDAGALTITCYSPVAYTIRLSPTGGIRSSGLEMKNTWRPELKLLDFEAAGPGRCATQANI